MPVSCIDAEWCELVVDNEISPVCHVVRTHSLVLAFVTLRAHFGPTYKEHQPSGRWQRMRTACLASVAQQPVQHGQVIVQAFQTSTPPTIAPGAHPNRRDRGYVGNTIGQANAVSECVLDLRSTYPGSDLNRARNHCSIFQTNNMSKLLHHQLSLLVQTPTAATEATWETPSARPTLCRTES